MVVAGAIGFYLPSVAMKGLPVGTAYAIWTGIGAAGTVAPDILFLKAPDEDVTDILVSYSQQQDL